MSEVGNSYGGQGVVSCGSCFSSHDVVAGHEEPAQAGHGGDGSTFIHSVIALAQQSYF